MQYPYSQMPKMESICKNADLPLPPDDKTCFRLWRKYDMLHNVRRHSLVVACIATALAQRAFSLGMPVSVAETRASALLHDIAKTWSIKYGGAHAQLGGAWTVMETKNYRIAQGVLLHVNWPWKLPQDERICSLPFFVLYADKRVRHDKCVTLRERFEDLLVRYGFSPASRAGINQSYRQAQEIECLLEKYLGWDLNENTFDCGRLVKRT